MKLSTKQWALVAGLALMVGGGLWLRAGSGESKRANSAASGLGHAAEAQTEVAAADRAYGELGRWQRLSLDVEWKQSVSLLAMGGNPTGAAEQRVRLAMRGEVELQVVAVREKRSLVKLSMLALPSFALEMSGMGTDSDTTTAEARLRDAALSFEALAEVTPLGEFVRIYTMEAPGPAAGLWHQVIAGIQTTLPTRGGPARWAAPERTSMGLVASKYRRKNNSDALWKVYRSGEQYLSVRDVGSVRGQVSGGSEIEWDTRGWLEGVDTNIETTLFAADGEQTSLAKTQFAAELQDTGVRKPEAIAWPEGGALLGQVEATAGTDKAMLAKRAEGWDRDRIYNEIPSLLGPASAEMMDKSRAMSAYLTLNPETCEELAVTMDQVGDSKTRSRMVDVLVSGQNERCQAAVASAVISTPLDNPMRNILLQRIAITRTPTIATASLLQNEMLLAQNSSDTNREFSAGTGLGAMVEMLDLAGRSGEADVFADAVSARLADASEPLDIEAYIRAASNMHRASVLPDMIAHVGHQDPKVRLTLAGTLDKFSERIAIDARLLLATDSTVQVQARALRGWVAEEPGLVEIARIADMVRDDIIAQRNAPIIVEIIRRHQAARPAEMDALAEAMLQSMELDGDIIGALRRLRARSVLP